MHFVFSALAPFHFQQYLKIPTDLIGKLLQHHHSSYANPIFIVDNNTSVALSCILQNFQVVGHVEVGIMVRNSQKLQLITNPNTLEEIKYPELNQTQPSLFEYQFFTKNETIKEPWYTYEFAVSAKTLQGLTNIGWTIIPFPLDLEHLILDIRFGAILQIDNNIPALNNWLDERSQLILKCKEQLTDDKNKTHSDLLEIKKELSTLTKHIQNLTQPVKSNLKLEINKQTPDLPNELWWGSQYIPLLKYKLFIPGIDIKPLFLQRYPQGHVSFYMNNSHYQSAIVNQLINPISTSFSLIELNLRPIINIATCMDTQPNFHSSLMKFKKTTPTNNTSTPLIFKRGSCIFLNHPVAITALKIKFNSKFIQGKLLFKSLQGDECCENILDLSTLFNKDNIQIDDYSLIFLQNHFTTRFNYIISIECIDLIDVSLNTAAIDPHILVRFFGTTQIAKFILKIEESHVPTNLLLFTEYPKFVIDTTKNITNYAGSKPMLISSTNKNISVAQKTHEYFLTMEIMPIVPRIFIAQAMTDKNSSSMFNFTSPMYSTYLTTVTGNSTTYMHDATLNGSITYENEALPFNYTVF